MADSLDLAGSMLASPERALDVVPHPVLVGTLGARAGASRMSRLFVEVGLRQRIGCAVRPVDTAAATPDRIDALLAGLEAARYSGLFVTPAFGHALLDHLDGLSREARAIGEVDTILLRDGRRIGHTIRYRGCADGFRQTLPRAARGSVLLAGAGNAGRAAAHALLDCGVGRLMIHDPDTAAAGRLLRMLVLRYGPGRAEIARGPEAAADADGLVNASPVGTAARPGTPVPPAYVAARHWIADMACDPLGTAFVAVARARGCTVLSGSGFSNYQAVRAFELFTGRLADAAGMRATFDRFDTETQPP